jgi:hypothetical protein
MTQRALETPDRRRRTLAIAPTQAAALLIAAAAVAYFVWYLVIYTAYPADDAFIHMRIARNLALHGVPYFNLGEPVAATSSPLWMLVLGAGFALAGPHPAVAAVLAGISVIGLYLALTALLRPDLGRPGAAFGAALLVAVTTLPTAAQLMESALALTFWCLALIGLRRQRFVLAGLFAGLAFCTRYEFVVWLALAFLVTSGWAGKRRFAAGAAGPIAGLVLFNIGFFGSLLPNTVRAKSIIYEVSFTTSIATLRLGYIGVLFFGVMALLALYSLALFADRERRPIAAAATFGAILIGLYVARQTLIFPWYPPLYLLPILTALTATLAVPNGRRRLIAAFLIVCIGGFPLNSAVREGVGLATQRHDLFSEYGPALRVQRYLQIGADLWASYPQARLLSSEVGALGWSFPGPLIDGAGLISPQMLRFHPMAVPEDRENGALGAIPPEAVALTHPELIVSMDIFAAALQRDIAAGRLGLYRLAASYPPLAPARPTDPPPSIRLWGAEATLVYIRTQ